MNPQIAYLLNLSIQQIESKRLDDAEHTLNQIIRIQPKNADALCFLSVIFAYRLDYDKALIYINKSLELSPKNSVALSNKGNILKELGKASEAKFAYEKAILYDSKNPEAYNNLGNLQQDLGQFLDAAASYEKAIKLAPNYAEAYSNKGNTLEKLGLYHESLAMYEKALKINPQYIDAWLNRAFTLNKSKKFQDAIGSCDRALEINPHYPLGWTDKGAILSENQYYSESIYCYEKAISYEPDFVKAWAAKGSALMELKVYEEALLSYEQAYSIDPNLDYLLGDIVYLKLLMGQWKDLNDNLEEMLAGVLGNKKIANPLRFCSAIDSPEGSLSAAKNWVDDKLPPKNVLGPISKKSHKKIRLGYFSADFRNHAVSLLTAELFELHNRDQFEVIAFSLKKADENCKVRDRLISAFDQFIDVEGKADIDIAEMARDAEIDIAIDLGGHTQFSPTGIMSHRAAPIQVNFLGYPGTLGANYMDYIVADPVLIPKESTGYYSEKIIYLPDTFMVDDSKRIPSSKMFTREECGLPENGFVYCCFNNSYKINKEMFQSWVRVLQSTPSSVFWISETNDVFKSNVSYEFMRAGIDLSRIIFAGKVDSISDHLARLRVADLFLDTLPYNAHSTSIDALKSGVPVLTLIGQSFASRVAASLLNAIELSELITSTRAEYEALAIELAMNPQKLADIKLKLASNRLTTPLFNTPLFTKNLEKAYIKMYERYHADLEPEHITIT